MNKKGFILPYVLFLSLVILNIFVLTLMIYINEKRIYYDKINFYQMCVLEERTKRHIVDKITQNNVENNETEMLVYGEDFVYLNYYYDEVNNYWKINIRIYHNELNEYATIYYDIDEGSLKFEIR